MQTSADYRSRRRHVSRMTDEKGVASGMSKVRSRVSNPVFTETEKPGNPEFFQNRKTGFWLPVNPVFRFLIFTCKCLITRQY